MCKPFVGERLGKEVGSESSAVVYFAGIVAFFLSVWLRSDSEL